MRQLLFLTVIVFLAVNHHVAKADSQTMSRGFNAKILEMFVGIANGRITHSRYSDGSYLGPLTTEEGLEGVIPFAAANRIAALAFDTTRAQWCSLDWGELSFIPVMKAERARKEWTDRQIAYIGLFHGVVQGTMHRQLGNQLECSEETKAYVLDFLTQKQW